MFVFSAELLILNPLYGCLSMAHRLILITKDNSLYGKTQFFNIKIIMTISILFKLTAIEFGMFQFILIKRREVSKYVVTLCCTANAQGHKVFNNTFKRSIRFCFDNSSRRSGLNMVAALTKKERHILFSKIFSSIALINFRTSFIKFLI